MGNGVPLPLQSLYVVYDPRHDSESFSSPASTDADRGTTRFSAQRQREAYGASRSAHGAIRHSQRAATRSRHWHRRRNGATITRHRSSRKAHQRFAGRKTDSAVITCRADPVPGAWHVTGVLVNPLSEPQPDICGMIVFNFRTIALAAVAARGDRLFENR